VLQRCVEYSEGEARDRLLAEIIANALLLAEDHYGFVLLNLINALRFTSYASVILTSYGSSNFPRFPVETM
jgi:hypothetical protein